MIPELQHVRDQLVALCREYQVARLDVFGSAAKGHFDPRTSDVDFLVTFFPDSPMGPFHQYFDFLASLERLLGREVDLVEADAVRNPYLLKSINESREQLYAA